MSSISNHSQSSSLEDEPLTEELLKRLLASTSPEAYLDREQIVACDFSQAITALYISHIHAESQGRPLYIVDKKESKNL